ncbi:MAG: PEGA domain-containing protein, partial [Acidobacteria bacterium]|nr:PEGA domain-containing protein [Acidobacteriota bacterium]
MRKAMPTGLLVLFFLAALPAAAQTGPLSQNDIIQMAQAKTPVEKIITQVRARGIAFVPSAELETTLTQLKVKKEHLQQLMAALRAPAAIELTANVAGGEVTLDGAPRGELSADGRIAFRDLSPGTHVIRLRARGHVPVNTDVFLKPGETAQVNLKLDSAVSATPGPLGTRVNVQAGTFEDTALAELDFEKDPAKRIERLEKIVATYGDDPFTLLAYGMLQDAYLAASNYDRALAAGQTLLERDPRNFAGTVRQARASMGRQELEPALAHAARARSLIEELKAGPAPDNLSAEAWERERQALLETAQPQLDSLTYDLLIAASDHPDPAAKTVLLERFLATFPDSPYRRSAFLTLALTAQGLGDLDRMLHWATQGLELDPNQGFLIVIVADTLSERGQDLARARELASRLLDLVSNQPDKLRPEGIDDAQWQG